MDILETIDAATGDLCACGCGRALDPAGPSGWWASEDCQARWHHRTEARNFLMGPGGQAIPVIRMELEAVTAEFVRVVQAVADNLVTFVHQLTDLARHLPSPPAPPVHPMLQAIEAKRHRNTGPKALSRAPRRIDATRGR